MTSGWSQFIQYHLSEATSIFEGSSQNALAPIAKSLGVLAVSGEDAMTFLQGQLTCDLQQLSDKQASPGGLCDVKGRVTANFVLIQQDDQYLLILPQDMLEIAHKRLKKYALFSKIKLSDVTQNWHFLISQPTEPSPSEYALSQHNKRIEIHYPGLFSLHISQEAASLIQFVEQARQQGATLFTENFWHYKTIQTKLASVHPQTSGLFTPQMLELEKYAGVSFNKGCYLGQEIIARTHHLGKLKRHLQGST